MDGGSGQARDRTDEGRRLVPLAALAIAVVAVVMDPSPGIEPFLAAVPVAAFAAWTYIRNVPFAALAFAVLVPVVVAQRSGALEPLLFESALLAFVVGRWSRSLANAASLGLLAAASPVAVALIQDPAEVSVGIWLLGIAFPWVLARAAAHQARLTAQLDATRRELDQQALLAERREIARDVHDFVGHGLAAVMLQVTSARHVLRRDPAAAEEALRAAEEVGRDSMRELRRTVALLRSDDEAAVASPLPSAEGIRTLVDHARAGGLAVELRVRGDLARIPPSVGVAVYRIAQEALANAARHAPRARTMLGLELTDAQVCLVAETSGPALAIASGEEPERARYGLIGMRERANELGGELSAGPAPGGWRVSCQLPLAASGALPGEGGRRR